MKTARILRTGLGVVLLTGIGILSGNATEPKWDLGKPVIIYPTKPIGGKPKAPSRQQINCVYSDGSLTFEFAIPEGQCQLVLSDPTTGENVAAGFDSAVTEPVYVGYHATASLTVTTANGNTYTGMW